MSAVTSAENKIIGVLRPRLTPEEKGKKKEQLWSTNKIAEQTEENRRVLRPRLTPEEKLQKKKEFWMSKEEVAKQEEEKRITRLPFIKFKGKLIFHIEWMEIAMICDNLLERANNSEQTVIGFDLEWPFSFQTGPQKTATIQISPDLTNCYVFHVFKFEKLPKSLVDLLAHDKLIITGNNIKNDVRKLARDFPGLDVEKMIGNCIDLGVLTNSIMPFTQRWSLEKLVGQFLNMRINKDKSVRMSKWHQLPLSKAQLNYAAIDAYASLLLYQVLKQKEVEMKRENNSLENEAVCS